MGFYCVDNLPVVLLPDLARTLADRQISAAVSIDVRNMPESPEIFEQAMNNLLALSRRNCCFLMPTAIP